MKVVDDFLYPSVREHALRQEFEDWEGYDGQVYKRICRVEVPGLREKLEHITGPVDMLGMGYRLNFNGEVPNQAIHSDLGWGTHALVCYLSEGEGGTAFWRHKATGATRIDPGDTELFARISTDWDRPEAWEMTHICPMKPGRAVIYESALFHSRWPFEAAGTGPEDGRLIVVAFFTPEAQ